MAEESDESVLETDKPAQPIVQGSSAAAELDQFEPDEPQEPSRGDLATGGGSAWLNSTLQGFDRALNSYRAVHWIRTFFALPFFVAAFWVLWNVLPLVLAGELDVARALALLAVFGFFGLAARAADRLTMPMSQRIQLEEARRRGAEKNSVSVEAAREVLQAARDLVQLANEARSDDAN